MDEVVSRQAIGSAIEFHRQLWPGLLESIYHAGLVEELRSRGIDFAQEVELRIVYKDVRLDGGFSIDLIVERTLIAEVKSVQQILPVHRVLLLTYLRLRRLRASLLLNFN